MATHTFFSATGEALGAALESATQSVSIFLSGACERPLFDHLLRCRRRGVEVELVIRHALLNRQSSLAWERLSAAGAMLHWQTSELSTGWPHSLCLMDTTTVITGTWHWGSCDSAQNCVVVETDIHSLEHYQAFFAKCASPESEVDKSSLTAPESPGTALLVSTGHDANAEHSLWELHVWQLHALAWETELAETQRQLALFAAQQEHHIGELLRSYLDLKRLYLNHLYQVRGDATTQHEASRAKDEYDQYQQGRTEQAVNFSENAGNTDPQQQAEIKKLYRKMAMLCHPDRVPDAHKAQAQALFQQVRQSYQRSDLTHLQQLHTWLQSQNTLGPVENDPSLQASGARRSNALQMAMQNAIAGYQQERSTLTQSATWRTLNTQPNWPVWFDQQAQHLQGEIHRFSEALEQDRPGSANQAETPPFSDLQA